MEEETLELEDIEELLDIVDDIMDEIELEEEVDG